MDNFDYKKYLVENKLTSNSRLSEEETQNGTTYLTIKEPLTQAIESMGYKKVTDDDDDDKPYPVRYTKPIDEDRELVVDVNPFGNKIKPSADFTKFPIDYNVVLVSMFIYITKEEEEKKFFGLVKKKLDASYIEEVINNAPLDLSKNTTEEAVDKITCLVKQKEPK